MLTLGFFELLNYSLIDALHLEVNLEDPLLSNSVWLGLQGWGSGLEEPKDVQASQPFLDFVSQEYDMEQQTLNASCAADM